MSSRYFKQILQVLVTSPFYTTCVQLPDADSSTPPKIWKSAKFHPVFNCTLGAIDGTHILCTSSAAGHDATRNCKGTLTQNCLAACSFDLHFMYFMFS
jgi:hypothetical protein